MKGKVTDELARFVFTAPVQYSQGQLDFYGIVRGKKVPSNLHHYKLENIQKVIEAGPQPG